MSNQVQIIITPPKVFLAGKSTPDMDAIADYLDYRDEEWNTANRWDSEALIEAAGRVCYQSWRNPKGSIRHDYIQESIVAHAHGSVLEHVVFNLLVADVPRSTQLELVRHRVGVAYSFESQRFTDKHLRFVAPPLIRENATAMLLFEQDCEAIAASYHDQVVRLDNLLRSNGLYEDEATLRRKRGKEAARALLPNCCGSDGMLSMNARTTRHFVEARTDEHADASIREFAYEVFKVVREAAPAVFADAEEVPAAFGPPAVRFATRKV